MQVRDSSLKVVFRPKQASHPQQQPQTAQVSGHPSVLYLMLLLALNHNVAMTLWS